MSDYPEDLPDVLASIAKVAGEAAALKIARAHGGTRVTVPSTAGDNWLTRLVGERVAALIIEELGAARRLDMPLGPEGGQALSRRERSRRYAELEAAGASEERIARELGLTGRAVRLRRAQSRRRHSDGQGELFSR